MAKTNVVSVTPEVVLEKPVEEEKILINIDREMTNGGIRINGKLYVGSVRVTEAQATDLLRIQEEYFETKKKLTDTNVVVRMKSDEQKEKLFLADPKENSRRDDFTRDYGLLPQEEWTRCAPQFKEYLLSLRKQLYGY